MWMTYKVTPAGSPEPKGTEWDSNTVPHGVESSTLSAKPSGAPGCFGWLCNFT
ncbi:MAG: hypothetical protein Aurels2KO_57540 [Aureliella sp.]